MPFGRGRRLAGQLSFKFGKTVTVWKVGWSGQFSEKCPNHLLRWDVLTRSAREDFEYCDFAGMTPPVAKALQEGAEFAEPAGVERFLPTLALEEARSGFQLHTSISHPRC